MAKGLLGIQLSVSRERGTSFGVERKFGSDGATGCARLQPATLLNMPRSRHGNGGMRTIIGCE